jgi:cyanate permease
MRRVWAAVLATWALLALVAVLAWSHPPLQSSSPGGATVVVVKGKKGRAVVLPAGVATHTTTHTSHVAR